MGWVASYTGLSTSWRPSLSTLSWNLARFCTSFGLWLGIGY
jgi:hypothetical protein